MGRFGPSPRPRRPTFGPFSNDILIGNVRRWNESTRFDSPRPEAFVGEAGTDGQLPKIMTHRRKSVFTQLAFSEPMVFLETGKHTPTSPRNFNSGQDGLFGAITTGFGQCD